MSNIIERKAGKNAGRGRFTALMQVQILRKFHWQKRAGKNLAVNVVVEKSGASSGYLFGKMQVCHGALKKTTTHHAA